MATETLAKTNDSTQQRQITDIKTTRVEQIQTPKDASNNIVPFSRKTEKLSTPTAESSEIVSAPTVENTLVKTAIPEIKGLLSPAQQEQALAQQIPERVDLLVNPNAITIDLPATEVRYQNQALTPEQVSRQEQIVTNPPTSQELVQTVNEPKFMKMFVEAGQIGKALLDNIGELARATALKAVRPFIDAKSTKNWADPNKTLLQKIEGDLQIAFERNQKDLRGDITAESVEVAAQPTQTENRVAENQGQAEIKSQEPALETVAQIMRNSELSDAQKLLQIKEAVAGLQDPEETPLANNESPVEPNLPITENETGIESKENSELPSYQVSNMHEFETKMKQLDNLSPEQEQQFTTKAYEIVGSIGEYNLAAEYGITETKADEQYSAVVAETIKRLKFSRVSLQGGDLENIYHIIHKDETTENSDFNSIQGANLEIVSNGGSKQSLYNAYGSYNITETENGEKLTEEQIGDNMIQRLKEFVIKMRDQPTKRRENFPGGQYRVNVKILEEVCKAIDKPGSDVFANPELLDGYSKEQIEAINKQQKQESRDAVEAPESQQELTEEQKQAQQQESEAIFKQKRKIYRAIMQQTGYHSPTS